MRRNSSRGHGGGGGGGPLRTDHLQLHDIDLELELLKRKREMIEQQQQILGSSSMFSRPSPFNAGHEPRPLFETNSFGSGYSQGFDPRQSSAFGGGGLLGKRPMNDKSWQNSPKRFSGPQGGSRNKFNSGPSPKQNQSRSDSFSQRHQGSNDNRSPWNKPQSSKGPKSNFPSQKFNNSKQSKPVRKDFKPTKVVKPNPPSSGKKPSSNVRAPIAKEVQAVKANKDENCILLPDQVPSQQMAGRLELALGNILKEIRTKYADSPRHVAAFQSMYQLRRMKQAIRERLRTAITGKPVGKVGAIVDDYRQVYPVATDEDIVQVAFETEKADEMSHLAIRLENADNAYKYFKLNMNRLLSTTLDDIFLKVQNVYEKEKLTDPLDICDKLLAEKIKDPFATKSTDENKAPEQADKNDAVVETDSKENAVETEKTEAIAQPEPMEELGKTVTATEEAPVSVNNDQAENDKAAVEEIKAQDENTAGDQEVTATIEKEAPKEEYDEAAKRLDELVLSLIRRRLPYILGKHKTQLMKVLNVAGAYHITKTAIIEKTQEKLNASKKGDAADKIISNLNESLNETTGETAAPSSQTTAPQYIVKILGRPVLPKRKEMQTFLAEFSPASVKKHKNMHLLFVAFNNKDNFDKIVAVKETTIGNATIFIKVSERTVQKADESLNATATDSLNATATESLNTSVSSQKESTDDISISEDLDGQIDDLLSTIRKEGEDTPVEETVEGEPAEEKEPETNGNGIEANANGVEQADDNKVENEEAKDKVEELKNEAKETGRATPTRASARVANVTPGSVRTRRASRLAQNN